VPWAAIDETDGFVHLSAADQVHETARRHFASQTSLVLIALESERLNEGTLRWEPSRGGALFPHVYGDVPLGAVLSVHALVGDDAPGEFSFPAELQAELQNAPDSDS
jgi:uncharacterized protein (DUF952 family)